MACRISLINPFTSVRFAIASFVNAPCLYMPLRLPFGAPGDAPPCIRQRPFGIAGARHGAALRVFAPQRGERCIAQCMGLPLASQTCSPPSGRKADSSDDSLPAGLNGHAFDAYGLATIAAVPLQRIHL